MTDINAFSFFVLRFNAKGAPAEEGISGRLRDFVIAEQLDDLILLSHGWQNAEADAMALYAAMTVRLRAQANAIPTLQNRRIGVAGIVWPSKWVDGSGAASAGAGGDADAAQSLDRLLDILAEEGRAFDEASLRNAVQEAVADEDALVHLAETLRDALPEPSAGEEEEAVILDPRNADRLRDALDGLGDGDDDGSDWEEGGGGAAGAVQEGFDNGVATVLNAASYYTMKKRAATVGRLGVARALEALRDHRPGLRIHLVGRSFGARLQTAAALEIGGAVSALPDSLCLLQAAFSQNSFSGTRPSPDGGTFRRIIDDTLVRGPIVVTHTHNDKRVLNDYRLASALAGQDADFGQFISDRFGGLGANGARHTDEAVSGVLQRTGEAYAFREGRIFNLRADAYIKNHSDIRGEEVAWLIAELLRHAVDGQAETAS